MPTPTSRLVAVGGFCLTCAVAVVASTGCANPDSVVGFTEPDTAARMRAIQAAGANGDMHAIPALISRLDSDDPAERLLASRTLERLTGESQGYEYAASKSEREAATARWVQWYAAKSGGLSGGVSAMTGGAQSP